MTKKQDEALARLFQRLDEWESAMRADSIEGAMNGPATSEFADAATGVRRAFTYEDSELRVNADPSTADHAMQSLSRRLAPGDPVGSLAADLCETAICEAMPPEEIERMAVACRRAAEICYGKPASPVYESLIATGAADVHLREAIERDAHPKGHYAAGGFAPGWIGRRDAAERRLEDYAEGGHPKAAEHSPAPIEGARCGAVHGAHVCARPAGHRGSHESESGIVGWLEEHEPPARAPRFPATGIVSYDFIGSDPEPAAVKPPHARPMDDDEPRDSGAHPGVMLDRSCSDSSLVAFGAACLNSEPATANALEERLRALQRRGRLVMPQARVQAGVTDRMEAE